MKSFIIRECIRLSHQYLPNHPRFTKFPHFTYVVQDNKIIEWGVNRTGVIEKKFGYYYQANYHSEFVAYKKAKGLLDRNKPFHIINIRLNKKGILRNSYPCGSCFGWLKTVGCKSVWFSTDNGMLREDL